MKGVVVLGAGELELRDFPDPIPEADEVVVRIKASGMCGTDLHHLHDHRRSEDQLIIEGHEPCGIISAVGSAVRPSEAKVGDRVMIHHYDGCRTCNYCRSGSTQFCANKKVIFGARGAHGGHAKFMRAPVHTAIKMPDQLSFKAGAAIACGAGTAYGAIKRVELQGHHTIAIFGQGPVGLAATIFAKAFGARVIALDIVEDRLRLAREFGADYVINPIKEDPVEAIRALTIRNEGADTSLECTSNEGARRQSIECLKRQGTACLVGTIGNITVGVEQIIQLQKNVIGSLIFSKSTMDECAQFVVERGIDLDRLFSHEFTLDQAKDAYSLFEQQKIAKGVFIFE